MDLKKLVYKPEENTYFGPNKPQRVTVLEQRDYGRGCVALISVDKFGYKLKPKAGYKIETGLLYLEVWEYQGTTQDAEPVLLYVYKVGKSKRLGKKLLKDACWDGTSLGIEQDQV